MIIKKEAVTDMNYGKNKDSIEERIDYGIVVINKPSGPNSHQISDYVKNILGVTKAGHSGTLDPGVTGVLPIALGSGTRIVEILLKSRKEYVALMHIHRDISKDKIIKVFREFTGKIEQLPPIRSAVRRRLREREIYYIRMLEIDNKDVLFRVGCQAGTYIRKLIHDIGLRLGTRAHMQQLIRTKAGPFTDDDWHSLHDLKDAYEFYKEGNSKILNKIILPIEAAVVDLPKVWIMDNAVDAVCHGASIYVSGISKLDDWIEKNDDIAIMTLKDELVGIGKSVMNSKKMKKEEKGVAVKINKVFMKRRTYPKQAKD